LGLSDANPLVSEALTYSGRADNWLDLFKLFEIVKAGAGGKQHIWKRGWATKDEITRFAKTANHARHAKAAPPSKPLLFHEGAGVDETRADALD